jgi:hypothetical protein
MKTDKKGTCVYEKDIHVSHKGQGAATNIHIIHNAFPFHINNILQLSITIMSETWHG